MFIGTGEGCTMHSGVQASTGVQVTISAQVVEGISHGMIDI